MAKLNTKSKSDQVTHEGAKAPKITPLQELRRTVMACLLWENNFYEDGVSVEKRIDELTAKVTAAELYDVILEAKHEQKLRHVPLLLTVLLARTEEGRKLVRKAINEVVTRPDDMMELLALYFAKNGKDKPIAAQIKKGLADVFGKFDAYQLAKYDRDGAIKLRDVLRITHPTPEGDDQAALWKQVLDRTLPTPDTWEVAISAAGSDKEKKKAEWQRLLDTNKLPAMATLRNLRNLSEAGIPEKDIKAYLAKQKIDRLLPINLIAAGMAAPQYEDTVEVLFKQFYETQVKSNGSTFVLVDISGSMYSPVSAKSKLQRTDVGTMLAMIAREKYQDVKIFAFDTSLHEIAPRRGFALREAILKAGGGGTTLGAAIRNAISKHGTPDRMIVITDEQSSDSIPHAATDKFYMINVGTYKNGVSYHNGWKHIDGWSENTIRYIDTYENVNAN